MFCKQVKHNIKKLQWQIANLANVMAGRKMSCIICIVFCLFEFNEVKKNLFKKTVTEKKQHTYIMG